MSDELEEVTLIRRKYATKLTAEQIAELDRKGPRVRAYRAIDSERDYQDGLWFVETPRGVEDTKPNPLTIGEFILLLESYTARSRGCWTDEPKPETKTLEFIRKVAGIAVNCMEQHGAPMRETDGE